MQETHGEESQSKARALRLGFKGGIFSLHTRATRGAAVLWKEPFFKISPEEWQAVRGSSALNEVKEKLERKQKILKMIYKNAYLNVKHLIEK